MEDAAYRKSVEAGFTEAMQRSEKQRAEGTDAMFPSLQPETSSNVTRVETPVAAPTAEVIPAATTAIPEDYFGQTEEQIEAAKAAGRAEMASAIEGARAREAAAATTPPAAEAAAPAVVATEAPTSAVTPEVETPEAKIARLEAELAAAQAKLIERPSRPEILKKQRESRKAAWEKTKKAAAAVRDEVGLVLDKDGREYVKEDIKAVKDEALRRANEAKDKAVTKATDALDWVGGKTVETLQTAREGFKDLTEFVTANINEPTIKAEVGAERLFDSLVARARLKTEDIKIDIQGRIEKAGGFVGRVARVAEGINEVLEREEFSAVEIMDGAAKRLAKEAREKAEAAAVKAEGYRATKAKIVEFEKENEETAENDRKKAEDRTKRANKFPNFVSKWRKLFGMG